MEIHRLHEMLTEAGIEHEWLDRTPPGWSELRRLLYKADGSYLKHNWGYQIIIYDENGERLVSAIEGDGTYGYGLQYLDGAECDLIEIMGLLTPEEAQCDSVVGWLTAEEVFRRIKEAVNETICTNPPSETV